MNCILPYTQHPSIPYTSRYMQKVWLACRVSCSDQAALWDFVSITEVFTRYTTSFHHRRPADTLWVWSLSSHEDLSERCYSDKAGVVCCTRGFASYLQVHASQANTQLTTCFSSFCDIRFMHTSLFDWVTANCMDQFLSFMLSPPFMHSSNDLGYHRTELVRGSGLL